jgi:hypothetical protein
MAAFIKSLAAGFALLGFTVLALSIFIPQYRFPQALAGLALMALNALAAVAFLGISGNHPVRTVMVSMASRLLALGAVMLACLRILKPAQAEAFSFATTALAGYLAFQALEIRHVLRARAAR